MLISDKYHGEKQSSKWWKGNTQRGRRFQLRICGHAKAPLKHHMQSWGRGVGQTQKFWGKNVPSIFKEQQRVWGQQLSAPVDREWRQLKWDEEEAYSCWGLCVSWEKDREPQQILNKGEYKMIKRTVQDSWHLRVMTDYWSTCKHLTPKKLNQGKETYLLSKS